MYLVMLMLLLLKNNRFWILFSSTWRRLPWLRWNPSFLEKQAMEDLNTAFDFQAML